VNGDRLDRHEGNLEDVGDLGDDGAFGEEAEECFANSIRKRGYEDAECCHLGIGNAFVRDGGRVLRCGTYFCCQEQERERIAVIMCICQNVWMSETLK
jgi:hypothetical protein